MLHFSGVVIISDACCATIDVIVCMLLAICKVFLYSYNLHGTGVDINIDTACS